MPSFLLTMRPHINEPSLLDTFLTIFFASDLFKSFTEYSYNIEKDNPIEAHFHMFFTTTLRDKEKVLKQLGTKEFKQFSAYLKNKQTNKQHCLDVQLVKKDKSRDHRLYTIGYTRKELNHTRQNYPPIYYHISSNELISALNYYLELTKIDKVGESLDIKVLSNKNAHATIVNYCKENNMRPTDPLLIHRLNREWIFTDFLSQNQIDRIQCSVEEAMFPNKDLDNPTKSYLELLEENKKQKEYIQYLKQYEPKHCEEHVFIPTEPKKIDCGYTLIYNEKKCNKCLEDFPCEKHPFIKEGD